MTNEEILKNINNYTFQYALNEIGTGFVQFFQMDFESILQGNKPKIDLKINELLTCYEAQINEVANGIINLNKEYNNQEIKKIYDNQYFRNLMLQLQKQAGTRYVFDLQKYKKDETTYIKELIDLLVYLKANYDIINSLINFIEISENSKTYLKTTMLAFKDLNDAIEKEIKSERKQFLGDKHKRNYNANIKFIIKNWNLS